MRKVKFLIFVIIFITGGLYESNAQVITGGSVGINYSNGLYLDASPIVGYRQGIIDVGIAPFFSYRDHENRDARYSFGNRVFAEVTLMKNVFIHGEFEMTNIETNVIDAAGDKERKWIYGLPVGAGYRHSIGKKTQAYVMVLYDVMLDDDSPVENPIVRGGVVIRL